MSYVYKQTGSGDDRLYTVGFYAPDGTWEPESDHGHDWEAAERVAWLNGSGDADLIERVERCLSLLTGSDTIKAIIAGEREEAEEMAAQADARSY